jgi:hypothetical protein
VGGCTESVGKGEATWPMTNHEYPHMIIRVETCINECLDQHRVRCRESEDCILGYHGYLLSIFRSS